MATDKPKDKTKEDTSTTATNAITGSGRSSRRKGILTSMPSNKARPVTSFLYRKRI